MAPLLVQVLPICTLVALSMATSVCVPYYLCGENNFVDVHGNIDVIVPRIPQPRGQCQEDEICCQLPEGEETLGEQCDYDVSVPNRERPSMATPKPSPSIFYDNQQPGGSIDNNNDDDEIIISAVKPENSFGCGIRRIQIGRIGGSNVDRRETLFGEYPWIVAIHQMIDGFWEYICVGTLISTDTIITAAHCLGNSDEDFKPSDLRVVAGDWDLSSEREPIAEQTADVSQIIRHEKFSRTSLINDIAILRVATPFLLGDSVDVICLNPQFNLTDCRAAGWAPTTREDGKEKRLLSQVAVPIVGQEECQMRLRSTRLGPLFRLHPSFICAGSESKDTCKGDGGGPLMCMGAGRRIYQVGIVSWGVDCGSGIPGIYSSIPYLYDWIRRKVDLIAATPP